MDSGPRPIYRAEAVHHHLSGRTRSVLPRFTSPRLITGLWLLVGLLLAGALGGWFIRVPLQVTGTAVIVDSSGRDHAARGPSVVALLPPEHRSHIEPGQTMVVMLGRGSPRLTGTVTSVGSWADHATSGETPPFPAPVADAMARLSLVVIGSLDALPAGVAETGGDREPHVVQIHLGTRPVLALLPGLGDALEVIR